MTTAVSVYPALEARPLKDTICLFDVDETLTKARRVRCNGVSFDSVPLTYGFNLQTVTPEMLELLSRLRHKCAIGYVRHLPNHRLSPLLM
jgi:phosphomannomutase